MREGQPVTVRIDAFPGLRLRAHVDSFQRGTGSTFALLPPENATGNFVKIVQRVPVKIMFDEPAEIMRRVAPGMSVEPTVTIAKMPRCLTWLLG
jgi:membrane fusion protein (multidrug efflux system)